MRRELDERLGDGGTREIHTELRRLVVKVSSHETHIRRLQGLGADEELELAGDDPSETSQLSIVLQDLREDVIALGAQTAESERNLLVVRGQLDRNLNGSASQLQSQVDALAAKTAAGVADLESRLNALRDEDAWRSQETAVEAAAKAAAKAEVSSQLQTVVAVAREELCHLDTSVEKRLSQLDAALSLRIEGVGNLLESKIEGVRRLREADRAAAPVARARAPRQCRTPPPPAARAAPLDSPGYGGNSAATAGRPTGTPKAEPPSLHVVPRRPRAQAQRTRRMASPGFETQSVTWTVQASARSTMEGSGSGPPTLVRRSVDGAAGVVWDVSGEDWVAHRAAAESAGMPEHFIETDAFGFPGLGALRLRFYPRGYDAAHAAGRCSLFLLAPRGVELSFRLAVDGVDHEISRRHLFEDGAMCGCPNIAPVKDAYATLELQILECSSPSTASGGALRSPRSPRRMAGCN